MDAECLECVSGVQPELTTAEEEGCRERDDETVGNEEGNQQQDAQSCELPETLQLRDSQKDLTCDFKQSLQTYKKWSPSIYSNYSKEHVWFAGYEITITESIEGYGGLIWPAARALCEYLEKSQEEFNLKDKKILELGSGTGLVSIVACILGAQVTATDLDEITGNLRVNLSRNTQGRRKYQPEVKALLWGHDLEHFSCPYDYVIAADVVYHHTDLIDLLETLKYLCQPGTEIIWANKFRFPTDFDFLSQFCITFDTELLAEFPDYEVKILKAKHKKVE
ncbi:protein-lysine methyltransferase METTL21C [Bombina bombina]|uniref:protein-lysine methyltransferase METTL21C n=1 Tax=Bombina bombina TaxID=8345 RepID=UPI00235B3024|nr:protein-lysine methyltransferase METTL21C [Bombina bombina]